MNMPYDLSSLTRALVNTDIVRPEDRELLTALHSGEKSVVTQGIMDAINTYLPPLLEPLPENPPVQPEADDEEPLAELGELSTDENALIASLRNGQRAKAYHPFWRLSAQGTPDQWTDERAIALRILGRLAEENFLADGVLHDDLVGFALDVVASALADGLAASYIHDGDLAEIRHYCDVGRTHETRVERAKYAARRAAAKDGAE